MGDVSVYGIYGYVAEKLEMDVAVQLLNQFGALIWIFIFRNIRAILPSGVKYGLATWTTAFALVRQSKVVSIQLYQYVLLRKLTFEYVIMLFCINTSYA